MFPDVYPCPAIDSYALTLEKTSLPLVSNLPDAFPCFVGVCAIPVQIAGRSWCLDVFSLPITRERQTASDFLPRTVVSLASGCSEIIKNAVSEAAELLDEMGVPSFGTEMCYIRHYACFWSEEPNRHQTFWGVGSIVLSLTVPNVRGTGVVHADSLVATLNQYRALLVPV